MTAWRAGQPVVVADYDPAWPERFARERRAIVRTCGDAAFVAIEHIGSTAVPGLAAKPIIDMMPGLRTLDDAPPVIARLEAIGYEYVPEFERPNRFDAGMPSRRYLRKDEGASARSTCTWSKRGATSGATTCSSATTCARIRTRPPPTRA
ncbi:MAG TPA: GrpB family protein [Dehalococcoidia bacterium]|nr:GrpB family protein [Dehalococcoidia bacterium]